MTQKPERSETISRREAIMRVSAIFGGMALVGQSVMLAGCEADNAVALQAVATDSLFSTDEIALMDEIAETILPATSTPGAKAAAVGAFMALMVTDSYDDEQQQIFRNGLEAVQSSCEEMHGAGFVDATPGQRLALLESLDAEQHAAMQAQGGDAPAHFFRMQKELALLGYFTSEIGYTQAMRYVESPGRFDPCVSMKPGDKTWARHA